jgi:hypothetical protein
MEKIVMKYFLFALLLAGSVSQLGCAPLAAGVAGAAIGAAAADEHNEDDDDDD